ncbi:MAG: oxidoreductase, partial [Alphaproteobacteria bacterium]|nr:oxidoreductase [Alphaproteobacteria bacterium]
VEEAEIYSQAFAAEGIDYICVSSAGLVPWAEVPVAAGYQVRLAAAIRAASRLPTRAVGLIATPAQAEAVLAEGHADMIALGRGFLDDPRWVWHAAQALGVEIPYPPQYSRATPKVWPGAAMVR